MFPLTVTHVFMKFPKRFELNVVDERERELCVSRFRVLEMIVLRWIRISGPWLELDAVDFELYPRTLRRTEY